MSYATALNVRRGTGALYRPAPDTPVFDAVCDILTTKTGKFNGELSPYMREPMNALGRRQFRFVAFAGPARCTKSLGLITGFSARNIVHDQGDMLVVHGSQDMARKYSKFELDPAIALSAKVREKMSARKADDNTYDKLTAAGMVLSQGWPSGQQLSATTQRYVAATEVDAAPENVDKEGSLFGLLSMRIETAMSSGKGVFESSVRRTYRDPEWKAPPEFPHMAPPVSGITGIYNEGTRKWLCWRCPGCGEWIELNPDVHQMFALPPILDLVQELPGKDAMKWARSVAVIPCRGCGYAIQESEKRALNLGGLWLPDGCRLQGDGEIIGEPIATNIDSYQLSCVAAAYASWVDILRKYAVGIQSYVRTGDQTSISETVNLHQGRAHLSMDVLGDSLTGRDAARTVGEDWPQGTVPHGVRFLTAQIDVQLREFVVKVTGWGVNGQQWPVDRYILVHSERKGPKGERLLLDPASYPEDWQRLVPKVLQRRYPLHDPDHSGKVSGRTMAVHFVVCDSGGAEGKQPGGKAAKKVMGTDRMRASVTANAYIFARSLVAKGLNSKFRLSKGGSSRDGKPWQETKPTAVDRKDRHSGAKGDVPVIVFNPNHWKDAVSAHYKRTTPGENYHHIPSWYLKDADGNNRTWLEQRYAEVREDTEWVQVKKRNEEFDLDVMGQVAVHRLGADRIDWREPPGYADVWERNTGVSGPDIPPPRPKPAPFRPRVIRSNHMQR